MLRRSVDQLSFGFTLAPVVVEENRERVQRLFGEQLGHNIELRYHRNRSTMISFIRRKGRACLRLHEVFLEAPEDVLTSIVRFVSQKRPGAEAGACIDRFLESQAKTIRALASPQKSDLQAVGEFHDLGAAFDRLNARYFGGQIQASVTWSREVRRKRRRSIRLGSYCFEDQIIRIHPALDQSFVPRYFVEAVVYHEMLHQVFGPEDKSKGRRSVHPPGFRAAERNFEHYEQAKLWEDKHVGRLLRY